jgi:hypothetical protein
MRESVQPPEPNQSTSVTGTPTERECREANTVAPPSIASDLVDIVGGAMLGLVLGVLLIP